MLDAYEWNTLIPLPTVAEKLATTSQSLMVTLTDLAHRIEDDHPLFKKKHPVFLYFFVDGYKEPVPVPVVGRANGPEKLFLLALTANGAAQLPPPFDSPPHTVKRDEALLMTYVARRIRDLLTHSATPPPGQDHQALAPPLIGSTYYTGQKDIMAALGVRTWQTVKGYKSRGLKITHNPAGKPQTTREEIDRWRASSTGKAKK